jgi:hypothetical protein
MNKRDPVSVGQLRRWTYDSEKNGDLFFVILVTDHGTVTLVEREHVDVQTCWWVENNSQVIDEAG